MKTYKDLQVWQKSIHFVTKVYKHVKGFPQEELHGLTAQTKGLRFQYPVILLTAMAGNPRKITFVICKVQWVQFLKFKPSKKYQEISNLCVKAVSGSYMSIVER
jgi:hypothetical protein